MQMQKAHLYEAVLLVNRGMDEVVRALERLKRAKNSGLAAAYLDEKLTLFELHRALLNGYFCNKWDCCEHEHAAYFEKQHRGYRKKDLDEIQVYQDVELLEQRRAIEGKPPKVRFLTEAEQRACDTMPRPAPPNTPGATEEGERRG